MKKLVFVFVCLLFVSSAIASPALLVTKPPVSPMSSYSGPVCDPHTIQGQWFKDVDTGTESVRPYEFYDNIYEYGGSACKGSLAIEGYIQNLNTDGQGNITGFSVRATITNDTLEHYGQWQEKDNLHGEEVLTARVPYEGTMYDTKMTVEFADDGTVGNLPTGGAYLSEKNIYAMEYDQLGWYCWTPNNPDQGKTPWGGYIVPTYDFGDIAVGQAVTRILNFGLYTAEGASTTLGVKLTDAFQNQKDIFANRTTSLKISQYVDNLFIDTGTAYPAPPRSSDVSVFFVPEPATLLLLVLGGAIVRRRKK